MQIHPASRGPVFPRGGASACLFFENMKIREDRRPGGCFWSAIEMETKVYHIELDSGI